MPISIPRDLSPIDETSFKQLDYRIMGAAFSIHNDYGRLLREQIYQNALMKFCQKEELQAELEVPIHLTHKTFKKTYYLDLLVDSGVIYELKATKSITPQHEAQLLNYLLLTNQPFGKIVNFGAASVETRFVSTSITAAERFDFDSVDLGWKCVSQYCNQIPSCMHEIVCDFGTRLDISVYQDALLQTIEPKHTLLQEIEFFSEATLLGRQPQYMLNEDTSLQLTMLSSSREAYANQLQRLLKHTHLQQIQWINIAPREIQFTSVLRK